MNQFSEKLENSLRDLGLSADQIKSLIEYFNKIPKDQFIYPNNFSTRASLNTRLANQALLYLATKSIVEVLTVPYRDVDNMLENHAIVGVTSELNDEIKQAVQDEEDIDPNDLKTAIAYRKCL